MTLKPIKVTSAQFYNRINTEKNRKFVSLQKIIRYETDMLKN